MATTNIRDMLAQRNKNKVQAPAPKAPAKKAAVVEEVEDELVEEVVEDEAPAPKAKPGRPSAKAPTKPAPKAAVVEEVEDEDETNEDELVEEVEDEAPAPKAKPGRPSAKAPTKPTTNKKVDEEVKKTETKKSMFGKKEAKPSDEKVYAPGSWLPRDVFLGNFAEVLREDEGFEGITKAQVEHIVKRFESFTLDTLANHNIKLFGVKSRQSIINARVYPPKEGLERVNSPYSVLVEPHNRTSFVITEEHGRTYGTINDDGEFVEGRFDAKGNFEEGTWTDKQNDEFTPKEAKKPAAKKPVGKK